MRLRQRQINQFIMILILISAIGLAIYYGLDQDQKAFTASLIAVPCSAGLLLAYVRGIEIARYVFVVLSIFVITFALGTSLNQYFHPLALLPTILALVLTSPKWTLGTALVSYIIILARARWVGPYTDAEVVIAYSILVGGLVISRMATDSATILAEANQRADEERQRAEQALALANQQSAELRTALETVATREEQLNHTLTDLQQSEHTIRELSAPILPILPGVLVAPLIGSFDQQRATTFQTNLLRAIERQHTRYVVFDVTGLPVLDTEVANTLIQAATAAQLLGAQVLLVGVRPEVAQTLVTLDVTFSGMAIAIDLQEAIGTLLQSQKRMQR